VVIDLGAEIEAMKGWQLRLRELKIEPGGHIGLHSHKDRPSVVLFTQGTDTVTNDDGSAKTFKAGDSTAEGVKTVHWHKNVGSDDVTIFTADLIKAPAK
jgi:quercetin dioxygenase-like cupin family protein